MKKLVTLSLILGISLSCYTQQFVQLAGAENILNGIDVGTNSTPVFVDIDNDLDFDMFVGTGSGVILFFKNTGSSISPLLVQQDTQTNPFGTLSLAGSTNVSFVDIDKDGDFDAFVGSRSGELLFYRNRGTKENPVFQNDVDANPLKQVLTEFQSACSFVDIDGDLDEDVFVGGDLETVSFYRNIGSPQNANYSLVDPVENPIQVTAPSAIMFPVFVDIDKDGDSDAFLGSSGSSIAFYRNVGSKNNPIFDRQTGSFNPLNSFNQPYSFLSFADLDLDGDLDVGIGQLNGTLSSYRNNTIALPLKLIAFTAVSGTDVTITWKTAEETNTSSFQLQKSYDGTSFTDLKTISAVGKGANSYFARDNISAPKQYYRLKIFDADGISTLSSIVHTSSVARIPKVKLYPNPVGRLLQIDFTDDLKAPLEVEVMDLAGTVRLKVRVVSKHSQIPVQQLSTGNYLLRLHNGTSLPFMKK